MSRLRWHRGTVETSVGSLSHLYFFVMFGKYEISNGKAQPGNTSDSVERQIIEGRSIGRAAIDYKPWILVEDVPCQGLATRVTQVKTGWAYFKNCLWLRPVTFTRVTCGRYTGWVDPHQLAGWRASASSRLCAPEVFYCFMEKRMPFDIAIGSRAL